MIIVRIYKEDLKHMILAEAQDFQDSLTNSSRKIRKMKPNFYTKEMVL